MARVTDVYANNPKVFARCQQEFINPHVRICTRLSIGRGPCLSISASEWLSPVVHGGTDCREPVGADLAECNSSRGARLGQQCQKMCRIFYSCRLSLHNINNVRGSEGVEERRQVTPVSTNMASKNEGRPVTELYGVIHRSHYIII